MKPDMKPDKERGAAAVEFALVLIPLVGLLFAVIQFGWLFHAWTAMEGGARQGARHMSIHNDVDDAKSAALRDMPTLGLSAADVVVDIDGSDASCDPEEFVTVTITYTSPMASFIPGIPSTITRSGVAQCAG
jgi:Flp pilus assembly protein TadG